MQSHFTKYAICKQDRSPYVYLVPANEYVCFCFINLLDHANYQLNLKLGFLVAPFYCMVHALELQKGRLIVPKTQSTQPIPIIKPLYIHGMLNKSSWPHGLKGSMRFPPGNLSFSHIQQSASKDLRRVYSPGVGFLTKSAKRGGAGPQTA